MRYKITSIIHAPRDSHAVVMTIEPVDGGAGDSITIPTTQIVEAIVELNSAYEITDTNLVSLVPASMKEDFVELRQVFPSVSVFYDNAEGTYGAETKDGDSGIKVCDFGPSIALAIANLACAHGYKSKLPTGGELTLAQWFVDFNYGFTNISQDLLRAEMDGITSPSKGSW